ncbi:MAG TPA: GNAT family N-acetyltransferase [Candidatus Acidoferrum sp.]
MQTQIPGISIRKAMEEDAPGILDCLREAFEEFRTRYTPEGFLDTVLTMETLQERLGKMSVFVAVNSANQVVGTIACNALSSGEGHLRGMAVLPSMRGNGVAAQLLREAEAELRLRCCTRVTLDTTEPLERAMRFYEKNGYRRSRRASDFFGMPLFEYEKSLTPR